MTSALTDHFQESSPRMRILFMRLQVLGQVIDTAAEERDLDLGRTRVRLMPAIGAR